MNLISRNSQLVQNLVHVSEEAENHVTVKPGKEEAGCARDKTTDAGSGGGLVSFLCCSGKEGENGSRRRVIVSQE